jgi:hypothetical protein
MSKLVKKIVKVLEVCIVSTFLLFFDWLSYASRDVEITKMFLAIQRVRRLARGGQLLLPIAWQHHQTTRGLRKDKGKSVMFIFADELYFSPYRFIMFHVGSIV